MSTDVCNECGKTEQESEAGSTWTQCGDCEMWYHDACVGIVVPIPTTENWLCKECIDEINERNELEKAQELAEKQRKEQEAKLKQVKEKAKMCKERQEKLNQNEITRRERKKRLEELKAGVVKQSEVLERLRVETDEIEKTLIQSYDNGASQNVSIDEQTPNANSTLANDGASVVMELLEKQARLLNRQYLLELPEFDGGPESWPLFIAQYRSTARDGSFTPVENLNRLRKCLKGKARKAVEGLLMLPDNVNQIIEVLEMCFGGMDVLVKSKLKALRDLPHVNENKPATVRNLFEFIMNTKACLTNVNATSYVQSPQFVDSLVEKLPANLERSWIKYKIKSGTATIDDFMAWFKPIYQCAILQDSEMTAKVQRVNTHISDDQRKSVEDSASRKKCPCCKDENHKLPDCGKFKKLYLRKRWNLVKSRNLCFICLLGKHYQKDCKSKKACNIDGCTGFHNPLLHKYQPCESEVKNQTDEGHEQKSKREHETIGHHRGDPSTHYRTLPVELKNGENSLVVWAFLDDGSGPTLLSESAAKRLKLDGPESEICLKWSDGERQQRFSSKKVSLEISGVNLKRKFVLRDVRTTPVLDLPMAHDVTSLKAKYKHLQDITMPDVPRMKPDLLIGLQHAKLMLPQSIREGAWDTPVASLTKLGWAIYGRDSLTSGEDEMYSANICECVCDDEKLDELIKTFHTTESFGVMLAKKQLRSDTDELAIRTLRETLKFHDGRYEVGLLWKDPNMMLPDNWSMALRRLICFERKLEKDPVLKQAVCDKFKENVNKGYLKKVEIDVLEKYAGRKWYLPMFSVRNPNKPNKIRLVYDAAAKFKGISLNDALLKGPDNQKSIFGVLIRGRRNAIVIGGDIREFYHQVKVKEDDQYCQLVCWRDMQLNLQPDVYVVRVLLMGSTCSSSSANEAKNVNAARFKSQYPRAYTAITEAHYADDYFDSVNSTEEAIELGKQVAFVHAEGGFEIRNWISNDVEVLRALDQNRNKEAGVDLNFDDSSYEEKILGLYWSTVDDSFLFKVSYARVDTEILEKRRVPTKREVVRVVMSPYDPMGMLAPIIVAAKVVVQSLWRSGCGWDDPIPNEILPAWENWLKALREIEHVRFPRWYSNLLPVSSNIDLHLFADSSELAFATVCYLRVECQDKIDLAFVAAKTRVAPQKALSIPRLELQAAVLATRLAGTILQEICLPINRVIFWTDSQTVLAWLRSKHRRYSSFVSNRVSEILEFSELESWRWVPSKKNVADEATKWGTMPVISRRWLSGPDFLRCSETHWPIEKNIPSETNEEERTVQFHVVQNFIIDKYAFINSTRFSKWCRILRAVAFALRYINRLNQRISDKLRKRLVVCRDPRECIKSTNELNGDELNMAKLVLLKKCQAESFAIEIRQLTFEKKVPKSSKIYKLVPFIDENGVLRASTRLDAYPYITEFDMKSPIVLDGSHRITRLIIESVHLRLHHRSKETVVSELRQCYWIQRIRVFVNQVIDQCCQCAVDRSKPCVPRMAGLPVERLSPFLPPFTNTGVDFMGPFYVAVGRRREKRWISLFTCMTMRAVHMEVACSLDTNSCVMCLRNFMSRRGRPRVILSDNATNFKATEKELKLMVDKIDWNIVQSESQPADAIEGSIIWRFIPPAAPHFGGAWERMVRTVKDSLYRVLKARVPKDETFRSAVIEVEAIVNSRPLSYTSTMDVNEPPITPNLLLRKGNNDPSYNYDVLKFDSRKQWVIAQQISQEFWNRWVLEYVPTIANRAKWYDDTKPLRTGELVLVMDTNLKRCEWRRGVVIEVFKSSDGRVRSAAVRTERGNIVRPVSKLAVIRSDVESL